MMERVTQEQVSKLDSIHHIAIKVDNIAEAVSWYREQFKCEISYQDDTWALLRFKNIYMALVIADQHPPHLGFSTPRAVELGNLKTHRDGTKSAYTADPFNNVIELLEPESLKTAGMEV